MEILIVVDMQEDFVNGALMTPEAQKIVPIAKNYIQHFSGQVVYTRDTHQEDYLTTLEGQMLPVPHCIKGTPGHEILPELLLEQPLIFDKPTFGSLKLVQQLKTWHKQQTIQKISLLGICTDICVLSNALLIRSYLPDIPLYILSQACAGTTPAKHHAALEVMQSCLIHVE